MPTFGVTSQTGYATTGNTDPSLSSGCSYVLTEAGNLTALSHFYSRVGLTGTQQLKLLLYADSAGAPGALKATSAAITVAAQEPGAYYTGAVSPAVPLTAGTYWIVFAPAAATDGSASQHYYKTSGTTKHWKYKSQSPSGHDFTVPPDPFGSATDNGVTEMAMYGTYTVSATNTVARRAGKGGLVALHTNFLTNVRSL